MSLVIMHTNKGDIKIELHDLTTPKTTQNFLNYVQDGFYNDTIFHRVIEGFVIQGGGLDLDMNEKETNDCIENEAKMGLKNETGTIAMARTSDPHSASSQFFINVNNNPFLDFQSETQSGYGYCVFGKVIEGLDIVKAISKVKTTSRKKYDDVPVEPIILKSIELIEETSFA